MSTSKIALKQNIYAIFVISACFMTVPMAACTSGVMNVGEQPISTEPSVTDIPTEGSTAPNSDTDSLDSTTANDGCEPDGVHYSNFCWYLGLLGESCIDACEERGGYNEATAAIVGSPEQGGSWEACRDVARLLGLHDEVGAGYRDDEADEGIGCHLWLGEIWWLYTPDLFPEARLPQAERICSCNANTPAP